MIKFKQEKLRHIEEGQRAKQEKELEECRVTQRKSISPRLSNAQDRSTLMTIKNGQIERKKSPDQSITHERLYKKPIHNKKLKKSTERKQSIEPLVPPQPPKSPKNAAEITEKLYKDAVKRQVQKKERASLNPPGGTPTTQIVLKTSQKSNEFYAGRLLKQIEKAFTDLSCFELVDFTLDIVTDLLEYLGYYGEQLPNKERVVVDAFKIMGGVIYGESKRNVTKKSFIVFLNAINNVFL